MPLNIEGVRINNREAWLQYKQHNRQLIISSNLLRKPNKNK